jgi:hypothetical protein
MIHHFGGFVQSDAVAGREQDTIRMAQVKPANVTRHASESKESLGVLILAQELLEFPSDHVHNRHGSQRSACLL